MSTTQITRKIEDLLELEKLMEEVKAEADTLRDEIKQEMINRNTDVLTVGQYIVRWTSVLSQRLSVLSSLHWLTSPNKTSPVPGSTSKSWYSRCWMWMDSPGVRRIWVPAGTV